MNDRHLSPSVTRFNLVQAIAAYKVADGDLYFIDRQ